jgi:hypothetical protein
MHMYAAFQYTSEGMRTSSEGWSSAGCNNFHALVILVWGVFLLGIPLQISCHTFRVQRECPLADNSSQATCPIEKSERAGSLAR